MNDTLPPAPSASGKLVRILGAIAIGVVCLALQWWLGSQDDGLRDGELVRELRHDGHTYALYFHRSGKYFNTIRKDGELVFDGRVDPRLRACIQELVVIDGALHRRCFLSPKEGVVTARLP